MAQRNAESVLPDPVGATTPVWWPELMASHAPAWAVVGALKLLRNHAAVAGEKRSSTSARLPFAIGPSLPSPTDTARAAGLHGLAYAVRRAGQRDVRYVSGGRGTPARGSVRARSTRS